MSFYLFWVGITKECPTTVIVTLMLNAKAIWVSEACVAGGLGGIIIPMGSATLVLQFAPETGICE